MTIRNKAVCFWLPVALATEVRRVSLDTGVPMSKIASEGIRQRLEKLKAVSVLMEVGSEKAN